MFDELEVKVVARMEALRLQAQSFGNNKEFDAMYCMMRRREKLEVAMLVLNKEIFLPQETGEKV